MENIQNIIEYYDELFVVTESQRKFFNNLLLTYKEPVKLLGINVGTGLFEYQTASLGHDVTGIDRFADNVRAASLRRRSQFVALRYFQMETFDMARFLGKGFYDVIYNLNNGIMHLDSKEELEEFLEDAFLLLSENGTLVLEFSHPSFTGEANMIQLPLKESLRAKLFTELWCREDGSLILSQNVETGNGKVLPVFENIPVYLPSPATLQKLAVEAGFNDVAFFSGYDRAPYDKASQNVIAIIQK